MKNHLAHQNSPYLVQHASNPVDWYPWGPQALQKARQEDKPIFLSIDMPPVTGVMSWRTNRLKTHR